MQDEMIVSEGAPKKHAAAAHSEISTSVAATQG